jgi:DNA-directed RNA polymerase specialized sigma24 family protein
MSSPPGSITLWLQRLQSESAQAAQVLWERFFARMVAVARQRLAAAPRRAADEEDVALSAFMRFHRGVQQGRFPHLHDREDLWRILFTLTVRGAANLVRDQTREKRGGGRVRGDSALGAGEGPPDDGPTPEEALLMEEGLVRLLDALGKDELRQIALARMEGYSNAEIARQQDCAEVTIERRLRLIRARWRQVMPGAEDEEKATPG